MRRFCLELFVVLLISLVAGEASLVQCQTKKKTKPSTPAPAVSELAKLRDEYISATKDYKASLEKLLKIYEGNVKKAEAKLTVSQKLFADGLIARIQLEEAQRAVATEQDRVAETRRQMASADTQIADVLVEEKANIEIAKNLRNVKGSLIRTTSYIRYNGAGGWSLSDAWKVQRFFSDAFNKPLPVAVFGQGSIHDRWRLDHRNAMDISLHPDGVEGQALMNFLQKNGIPFSAFREAIPGTATGPHIHIGRPSHRY